MGSVPESIDNALKESGRGQQRHSPLQPRLMMWLVGGVLKAVGI